MTKSQVARGPILVTGMPRSGTTWLARLLATAPGTALPGREPMNARGRQFALAGTIDGWTRLRRPTRKQVRALRRSYAGLHPLTYSRYGHRQWAAAWPSTRLVVKDPFAMLSVPTIAEWTGASPVLLYRHPGAMLVSYRRMGWSPDLDEIRPVVDAFNDQVALIDRVPEPPRAGTTSEAEAMGQFWNILYGMALHDLTEHPGTLVVAHEELALGGLASATALFARLGLALGDTTPDHLEGQSQPTAPTAQEDSGALHRFGRNPQDVASSWRRRLEPGESEEIEAVTNDVADRLASLRTVF